MITFVPVPVISKKHMLSCNSYLNLGFGKKSFKIILSPDILEPQTVIEI